LCLTQEIQAGAKQRAAQRAVDSGDPFAEEQKRLEAERKVPQRRPRCWGGCAACFPNPTCALPSPLQAKEQEEKAKREEARRRLAEKAKLFNSP
jgi:hypothetical protein